MIVKDDEYLDFNSVPQSRGIPVSIYLLVLVGIVGIFAVGADTVFNAGYGHKWPSEQTLRMPLGEMPK